MLSVECGVCSASTLHPLTMRSVKESAMAVEDISTRICARCKKEKPNSFFRVRKGGKLFSYCHPCEKEYKSEYAKANSARIVAKTAKWRAENQDKYKAYTREYQKKNRARFTARSLNWAKKNPESRKRIWTKYRAVNLSKARQSEAAYRERNRAVCNARVAEWKKNNKDLLAYYSRSRQAAILRAIPSWANSDAIKRIYAEAHRKRQELGEMWHVDHIVPLLGKTVCGLHCEANLQVIPGKENLSKNRHRWPDMP